MASGAAAELKERWSIDSYNQQLGAAGLGLNLVAARSIVVNCVSGGVSVARPEASDPAVSPELELENFCVWAYATPVRPNSGSAIYAHTDARITIRHCLIEASHVTLTPGKSGWTGQQNVYRILGSYGYPPANDLGSIYELPAILDREP